MAQVNFMVLWHTGVVPSWVKFLLGLLYHGKGLIPIYTQRHFTLSRKIVSSSISLSFQEIMTLSAVPTSISITLNFAQSQIPVFLKQKVKKFWPLGMNRSFAIYFNGNEAFFTMSACTVRVLYTVQQS